MDDWSGSFAEALVDVEPELRWDSEEVAFAIRRRWLVRIWMTTADRRVGILKRWLKGRNR
jgi:hypothetical protein